MYIINIKCHLYVSMTK